MAIGIFFRKPQILVAVLSKLRLFSNHGFAFFYSLAKFYNPVPTTENYNSSGEECWGSKTVVREGYALLPKSLLLCFFHATYKKVASLTKNILQLTKNTLQVTTYKKNALQLPGTKYYNFQENILQVPRHKVENLTHFKF